MSNSKKIIIAVLVVSVLLVSFFSVWGVSRIQLSSAKKIPQSGDIADKEWSDSLTFNIQDFPRIDVSLNASEGFKVLYLTDLHYKNSGWFANYFWFGNIENNYISSSVDYVIDKASPDLIILSGDIVTCGLNDLAYRDFADNIDKHNIPWTLVFGNHDAEHRADKAILANIIMSYKNCLFDSGFTNIGGLGNSVLNVFNNDALLHSFILMDSMDWNNSQNMKASKKRDYNKKFSSEDIGISQEKTDWYKWIVNGLIAFNGGSAPLSTLVTHIPIQAQGYAFYGGEYFMSHKHGTVDEMSTTKTSYDLAYDIDNSSENFSRKYSADAYNEYKQKDSFFKTLYELNSTKKFITGHNHSGGFAIKLDGLEYFSVPKTSDTYVELDWDEGNRGGLLTTFYSPTDITEEFIYHTIDNKKQY